jgi:hypothetical protein
MNLEKGLRNEYHFIADTWDVHSLSINAVKRNLRQKCMRTESRAQSRAEPPTPTALGVSHDDASTDILKRQVSELQDKVKYLQSAATPRSGSYGGGAARLFRGVYYSYGKKGHRMSELYALTTAPKATLRGWSLS